MSSTNPAPPVNNSNNPQTHVAQEIPPAIMQTQTIVQQPPQAPLTNVVDPNGVAVPNNDPKINNEEFEEIREQVRTCLCPHSHYNQDTLVHSSILTWSHLICIS